MGYVWSDFGVLEDSYPSEDGRYLIIENVEKETRKISLAKYAPAIPRIKQKIEALKDRQIQIRTSQNTDNWSSDVWFSDLSLANTVVADSGGVTSDETIEELTKKLAEANAEADFQRERADKTQAELEQLRADFEALTEEQKHEAIKASDALDRRDIVGDTLDFQCKGHALKTLALRMGIVHKGRLYLRVLRKLDKNWYEVEMSSYDDRVARVALGFDSETYFIYTFDWSDSRMRPHAEKMGYSETDIKSSADKYSLDDLAAIHKKISNSLFH